jgi:glycosyltransferase involved in cell wall biosynthesis
MNIMKFVIITPTRNEEKFIEETLSSMLTQTLLPLKWIIVDDGSTDDTSDIIKKYMKKADFIEYLYRENRGFRKPGQGVVEAFYAGYEKIKDLDFDVISKLDADLRLPPDTLELIAKSFKNDVTLGVAGGTRFEKGGKNKDFRKVLVPKGFVGGPNKFYRKQCFEEIGGLIPRAGWDGVDTIKANMHGWKTGELDTIKILHLKPTGTAKGEGLAKACEKYGDVSYYMGGYFWYFIVRLVGRSLKNMNPRIGYYMMKGYLNSLLHREKRESDSFRKYLKNIQIKNMKYWINLAANRPK